MTCNLTLPFVDKSILEMCYYYFSAGVLAAIVEAVNLLVMLRTPYAFTHNFFIICLKFANLFNGLSYIVLGAERYWLISTGHFAGPTTYGNCFFGSVVPSFLIVGTSLPALFVLVIAVDRMVAVWAPAKYRRFVVPRFKLATLPAVLGVQMFFLLLAAIPSIKGGGCDNARWCSIIASTSLPYSVFHFSFMTLSHFVGFLSLLFLFVVTKTSTAGLSKSNKKHILLGLLETGCYTLCVALPSAVMVTRLFVAWAESILIDVVNLCIPTVAIASFAINCASRKEYRSLLKSLCTGKTPPKTITVQPSAASTALFTSRRKMSPSTIVH